MVKHNAGMPPDIPVNSRPMKIIFTISVLFLVGVLATDSKAQKKVTRDTIEYRLLQKKAKVAFDAGSFDSAAYYYDKVSRLYQSFGNEVSSLKRWAQGKMFETKNELANVYFRLQNYKGDSALCEEVITNSARVFGGENVYQIRAYTNKGILLEYLGQYELALDAHSHALSIERLIKPDKDETIAITYDNLGNVNHKLGALNKAMEYHMAALELKKEIFGESNYQTGNTYINIGILAADMGDYDKAIEYDQKALDLFLKLHGEKQIPVYQVYNNLGVIYYYKEEYKLALEYFLKCLKVMSDVSPEKSSDISALYVNLGETSRRLNNLQDDLDYTLKALQLDLKVLGATHPYVALDYNNIGDIYLDLSKYDSARAYHQRSLRIRLTTFGEDHSDTGVSYYNMGLVEEGEEKYDSALYYYSKAATVFTRTLGDRHPYVAVTYRNIGQLYELEKKYDQALKALQKGLIADLRDFNDSTNLHANPAIKNYLETFYLLDLIYTRAQVFFEKGDYEASLKNFQMADTLLSIKRRTATSKDDKIAIGEDGSLVYEGAIKTCFALMNKPHAIADYYKGLAFYFSEKNKGGALLEALGGQEGLKFSGIPDSLLEKEHALKMEISSYEEAIATGLDSATEQSYRNSLFDVNRKYDDLIKAFEVNYTNYYNLKYSNKTPSVSDLQNLLDKKTAIRSFFDGDSLLYVFTLSHRGLELEQVVKPNDWDEKIVAYMYELSSSRSTPESLTKDGYEIFRTLFPPSRIINKETEDLIIIPEGTLGLIPFESLPVRDNNKSRDFHDFPFLINKFNISYSYSATLFYQTFPKVKQKTVETTELNDWLALAPVFDSQGGVTLASRELRDAELGELESDSVVNRSGFIKGGRISELPGTETEIETIFREFEQSNMKAKVLLRGNATEDIIKSGELKKYRIIHIATHGFMNRRDPELSGLLLTQDENDKEDGILYAGEIYNLQLESDLVVLSACETGIGKIERGEGIIGLTRALLYAGTKNIIVSLWKVADKSTADLMIDFYHTLLKGNYQVPFSTCLREAKLKMIAEGKFAHPYYWSPFILIGK